jgi:hypothetical protein
LELNSSPSNMRIMLSALFGSSLYGRANGRLICLRWAYFVHALSFQVAYCSCKWGFQPLTERASCLFRSGDVHRRRDCSLGESVGGADFFRLQQILHSVGNAPKIAPGNFHSRLNVARQIPVESFKGICGNKWSGCWCRVNFQLRKDGV